MQGTSGNIADEIGGEIPLMSSRCLVLLCPPATTTEFRAGSSATVSFSSCNKDLAVGQQGGGVSSTTGVEIARSRPSPARRVIQLRTRKIADELVLTSCNKHVPIAQQVRRVKKAANKATCDRPTPAGRIVQLRAWLAVITCCNQDLAVGHQSRGGKQAAGMETPGGGPSPARRIVKFCTRESKD